MRQCLPRSSIKFFPFMVHCTWRVKNEMAERLGDNNILAMISIVLPCYSLKHLIPLLKHFSCFKKIKKEKCFKVGEV